MRTPLGRLACVTLLLLVGACASASRRSGRDVDVLTQREMLDDNFTTVYDAVTALRSNWLNIRPNTLGQGGPQGDVVVYYDATRLGGPTELQNISVRDVVYVQHFDAVAATQRWGVGHSQGAILVSTHPN
jgi:hypothetical protein